MKVTGVSGLVLPIEDTETGAKVSTFYVLSSSYIDTRDKVSNTRLAARFKSLYSDLYLTTNVTKYKGSRHPCTAYSNRPRFSYRALCKLHQAHTK